MQELTEAGYACTTPARAEAIASVRTERPDLVILDVMMPEMNGFDVAAVLKKTRRRWRFRSSSCPSSRTASAGSGSGSTGT